VETAFEPLPVPGRSWQVVLQYKSVPYIMYCCVTQCLKHSGLSTSWAFHNRDTSVPTTPPVDGSGDSVQQNPVNAYGEVHGWPLRVESHSNHTHQHCIVQHCGTAGGGNSLHTCSGSDQRRPHDNQKYTQMIRSMRSSNIPAGQRQQAGLASRHASSRGGFLHQSDYAESCMILPNPAAWHNCLPSTALLQLQSLNH
jgi:hypothetical protein